MALERGKDLANPIPPHLEKERFLDHIRGLMASASPRLLAAQRCYKVDYDRRLRPLVPPGVGDLVYLRRGGEVDEEDSGVQRRHKLQSKALGPYPVVRAGSHTVEIDRDRLREADSRDRIVLALPTPVLPTNSTMEEAPQAEAPEFPGCLEPREAEPED